ncbi:MAG: tRNA (guanosine(37)-N1)-methyltransferase TrmD [Candidatus Oxydemutatoraceae bacterium WSBS_2016_MAG_OTU14]
MRVDIVSIFPEFISAYLVQGIVAQAIKKNLIQINTHNLRDFSDLPHHNVDDRPFGGGDGMVMMAPPIGKALEQIQESYKQANLNNFKTFYLSPQGKPLTQSIVCDLADLDGMVLLCGRYKGVDQRILDEMVDEEYSIGDYVLSGGELAALVLTDAVVRHCPNVLGNEDSARNDSFMHGMLDAPHYTRPREYNGRTVPDVLLSGHAENIRLWRLGQMLARTAVRRTDLFEQLQLDESDQALLDDHLKGYLKEQKSNSN